MLSCDRGSSAECLDSPAPQDIFALHFTRGGNLGDVEQLAAAAAAVGLDAERARTYLTSGEGVRELESAFEQARELGIAAVPMFVIDGRWAIQGAQPVSTFVRILELILSTPTATGGARGETRP